MIIHTSKESFNILVEKEYYPLKNNKPTIGLVMMVKNEKARLQVSLDSVTGFVDCFIMYDTGSTDNTIDIIKNHCEKHKINLYFITGDFVNFSDSRNEVLKYADTINVKFLLLLDTNDELRGGENLKKFAKNEMDTEHTGYLVCQEWWSGQYDKYFNMRFHKNKSGWRYRGAVHEWLKNENYDINDTGAPTVRKLPSDIVLYQDRTQDDDKTGKRFSRDKKLLLKDHKKNPKDPRTLFYLAQTCACLGHHEDSLYYYKQRTKLEGFQEEKFHSFLRCGELSTKMGLDWEYAMTWYMKAIEHSNRAEPYIKIAEYYQTINKFEIAYMFTNTACQLAYPDHCILFVDKHSYDYKRWHLLGIVGFYVGKFTEGKAACEKAIETGSNIEIDKKNLDFYLNKEKEIGKMQTKSKESNGSLKLTKNQFIQAIIPTLKEEHPKFNMKKILKIANNKWKNR